MKKILICALLLAACMLGGCKKKAETDGTDTDAVTTTAPVSVSEASTDGTSPAGTSTSPAETSPVTNGVLTCQRSGDSVTVNVTLPECAGQEVSLLALSDPQYQYSWSENSDALHDIGQIALDSQGNGSITMKLKNESEPIHIILTAASGSYTMEVN